MTEPRHKIRALLPQRLRPVFDRLTHGFVFDRQGYRTLLRIAEFLCEIDKRAGTPVIKAAMRQIERTEKLADEQTQERGGT